MTNTSDPNKFCDPIADFDSPQSLMTSIYILIGITVICYTIALIIM